MTETITGATSGTAFALSDVMDAVLSAARSRGDEVVLREGPRTIGGRELAEAVDAVSIGLDAQGLGSDDTVLFGVRPGIDAFILLLAIVRCGACLTFVEPGGRDVVHQRLALANPTWTIAESALYFVSGRGIASMIARRVGLHLPRLKKLPGKHVRVGRRLPGTPPTSIAALLKRVNVGKPDFDRCDTAKLVIFTSGTTGNPKGVVHDATSIAATAHVTGQHFHPSPDAVVYTHKLHAFMTAIEFGASAVVAPLGWDADRCLVQLHKCEATHTFLAPSHGWDLARAIETSALGAPPKLKEIFLMAAPITVPVVQRMHAALPGVRIHCIYGMTEMGPVSWIDSHDKVATHDVDGDVVGKPAPEVEVKLVDDVLHVRGPHKYSGYMGHEPNEWHNTGDLARIDNDGNIVLMGRSKDMLLRGDFNLYPGLYEPTIAQIEGVAACAIVGVPDPVTADEAVILYVEMADFNASPSELEERVKRAIRKGSTSIDRRAWPDHVHAIDSLPRSGRSDKIDRKQLRSIAIAEHAATGGTA